MKMIDWVKENMPNRVVEGYEEVVGCPHYDIYKEAPWFGQPQVDSSVCDTISTCDECWHREFEPNPWHGIVSKVEVYGLERARRVAQYPMHADLSEIDPESDRLDKLAKAKPGEGHANVLNGIIVQFDLTFTNKAWVEAERYHWFDINSSQSTMHRIAKFDIEKNYITYTDKVIVGRMKELAAEYNADPTTEKYLTLLYSNPAGFKLTAGMSTNYLQLKTIYQQRRNHRLPEWRAFCKWIESLPESQLITGVEAEE